jgi:hypothetical protein
MSQLPTKPLLAALRELGGPREAAPVDELGGQHQRRVQGDPADALQATHHGRE